LPETIIPSWEILKNREVSDQSDPDFLKPRGIGENYPAAEKQAEKGLWGLSWDFEEKIGS
jgi:hypothetical protein